MSTTAHRVTAARKAAFLDRLARTGNVTAAARDAGIGQSTVYKLRRKCPDFDRGWDEALEQALAALEIEARRRAVEGWDKPVYYRGQPVGTVRHYSDKLLELLLKAHRPEVYDRSKATKNPTAPALPPGSPDLAAPPDLAERMMRGRQRVDAYRKQAGLPPIDWDGPL